MKSKLFEKKNKGETIVEMLVSVLIGALAIAMLASAISYSVKTTKQVDDFQAKLSSDTNLAEGKTSTPTDGTIIINYKSGGTSKSITTAVSFYGNSRMMTFEPK